MPDGPNPWARWLYLNAVSLLVPEALVELVALEPPRTDEERIRCVALHAWAERWGFTDPWALDIARVNAERWRDDQTRWNWTGVTVAAWTPVLPPAPTFNPNQPLANWRKRIKAYEREVLSAPGLVKTPEKRLDHFEWLALNHVGRWTYDRIIEKYPGPVDVMSPSTVSEAINTTAALVGLTMRDGPGRSK